MSKSTRNIFTSPAQCESAFYQSLLSGDIDSLSDVWAKDEDVYCILPSGIIIIGYNDIIAYYRNFFASTKNSFFILATLRQQNNGVMFAIHNLIEEIKIKDLPLAAKEGKEETNNIENPHSPPSQVYELITFATNIFIRAVDGWRLLSHQATATNPNCLPQKKPNEENYSEKISTKKHSIH